METDIHKALALLEDNLKNISSANGQVTKVIEICNLQIKTFGDFSINSKALVDQQAANITHSIETLNELINTIINISQELKDGLQSSSIQVINDFNQQISEICNQFQLTIDNIKVNLDNDLIKQKKVLDNITLDFTKNTKDVIAESIKSLDSSTVKAIQVQNKIDHDFNQYASTIQSHINKIESVNFPERLSTIEYLDKDIYNEISECNLLLKNLPKEIKEQSDGIISNTNNGFESIKKNIYNQNIEIKDSIKELSSIIKAKNKKTNYFILGISLLELLILIIILMK